MSDRLRLPPLNTLRVFHAVPGTEASAERPTNSS